MSKGSERPIPLSAADSAWLRMEDPTNLMTITSVMTVREPLGYERLAERIRSTLLAHDRFHMRVSDPSGRVGKPAWVAETLDLESHLVRARLEDPWDRDELQALVSREMSTPLDFGRPLWKFLLIGDFRGGSAIVCRIHHCIGDGMALMRVLLGMADGENDDAEIVRVGLSRPSARGERHGPLASGARLLRAVKGGGSATRSLGRLLAMRADPRTPFKGELGIAKRAVWSGQIPLATIKRIGKGVNATVNDVLLAAVTEALRCYLTERSGSLPERDLRAVVPVNIRPADDRELGNQFGLVYLSLPVGLSGREERVLEVNRRMDALKRSPEAFVVYAVLRALGATHAGLQTKVVKLLSKNATAVMTNVPGPRRAISICGAEIDDMMFWVPQSGRLGLGVSILSYNDQVRLGVAADLGLIPDPERLTEGFEAAVRGLAAALSP